jgi:hypothetical protein
LTESTYTGYVYNVEISLLSNADGELLATQTVFFG